MKAAKCFLYMLLFSPVTLFLVVWYCVCVCVCVWNGKVTQDFILIFNKISSIYIDVNSILSGFVGIMILLRNFLLLLSLYDLEIWWTDQLCFLLILWWNVWAWEFRTEHHGFLVVFPFSLPLIYLRVSLELSYYHTYPLCCISCITGHPAVFLRTPLLFHVKCSEEESFPDKLETY